MQITTKAQGPVVPCIEYITIGNTIYNITLPADYAAATGELRAFLDARALGEAVERELQNITERMRARLRAQLGVPVVSAHAVMRAAQTLGVQAQVETWIANNSANHLAIRLRYGAENITQAELVGVSPAQGAAIFAAALAL